MNKEAFDRAEKCRVCERRIKIAKWRNIHWTGWGDCPLPCPNKPEKEEKK